MPGGVGKKFVEPLRVLDALSQVREDFPRDFRASLKDSLGHASKQMENRYILTYPFCTIYGRQYNIFTVCVGVLHQ